MNTMPQQRLSDSLRELTHYFKYITLSNDLAHYILLYLLLLLKVSKIHIVSEAWNFHSRRISDLLGIFSALNRWEKIEMLWR